MSKQKVLEAIGMQRRKLKLFLMFVAFSEVLVCFYAANAIRYWQRREEISWVSYHGITWEIHLQRNPEYLKEI